MGVLKSSPLMTMTVLEGFGGSTETLERLQKGTEKPWHGFKPTHPTQTVDLSKRIPIKNYTFNSSNQKNPIWRTVKASLPEQ